MKRFLIVFVSLALFTGFLTIKPPALAEKTTTVATTADPIATPITSQKPLPTPANGKPVIGKPKITGGDEEDEEDGDKKGKEKPIYGGHDDDDYDD
jgi:hypothetical protein